MYIVVVLLQTVLLPFGSGAVHLAVSGGDPWLVMAIWTGFWGVGTRLVVAGISQLVNPARTAQGILGIESTDANQVVHELGFANLSLGVVALAVPFLPGWGVVCALPGAVYMGLAGLRHVAKPGKDADELVATWTDLLVFAVTALGVVAYATSR